jgi:hypothetical protein
MYILKGVGFLDAKCKIKIEKVFIIAALHFAINLILSSRFAKTKETLQFCTYYQRRKLQAHEIRKICRHLEAF